VIKSDNLSTTIYFRSERALQSPAFNGIIEEFCREKGHGYIRSNEDPTQLIFAHVSE
jgi:hypothetical protein